MPRLTGRVVCVAVCVLCSVAVLQAAAVLTPLTIYSTGQGLPIAGTIDPNYVLISTPANPLPPPSLVVLDPNGWPIKNGPYYTSGYAGHAAWITPQVTYSFGQTDPAGNYIFQTTFMIPDGVDPNTVLLWGTMSSDNVTQGLLVNGTPVVWAGGNTTLMVLHTELTAPHNFQIGGSTAAWNSPDNAYLARAAFLPGLNTLQFQVNNLVWTGPNPVGLVVWIQGQGMFEAPVPEAATAGLLAAGLAAVALLRRLKFIA
jgi:hypothetical protein